MNNDVPLGRCEGLNDKRKTIELAMTFYRIFMQGLLYKILSGEQYKPRPIGPVMFARLRSNVIISVLCSNDL